MAYFFVMISIPMCLEQLQFPGLPYPFQDQDQDHDQDDDALPVTQISLISFKRIHSALHPGCCPHFLAATNEEES